MGLFGFNKKSEFEKGMDAYKQGKFQEAKELLRKAGEKGSARALFNLGVMAKSGEGGAVNPTEAFNYFKASADLGFPPGFHQTGLMLLYGEGVSRNLNEAARYMKLAADNGIPEANGVLQQINDFNNIVERAQKGDADSAHKVGIMYATGQFFSQDMALAKKWFEYAADLGHIAAMNDVADLYLRGVGTEKDEEKALQYFKKAAEAGLPVAQYAVAHFYYKGIGRPVDNNEAFKWAREAALNGFSRSQVLLGYMYYNGLGVEKNPSMGHHWNLKAAEQGNPDAMKNVSYDLKYGFGVEQNLQESFNWAKKYYDADKGADASSWLGSFYINEIGTKENPAEAFRLLSFAASYDDVSAQINLGYCYYNGIGVAQDYKKAWELFEKARGNKTISSNQYALVVNNMAVMRYYGYGVPRDVLKAMDEYKSVSSVSGMASYNIAQQYYYGCTDENGKVLVKKDHEQAYVYFRNAASLGFERAKRYLSSDLSKLNPSIKMDLAEKAGKFVGSVVKEIFS